MTKSHLFFYSVAGSLDNVFKEKGTVEIQAIGVGALNKLLKQLQ